MDVREYAIQNKVTKKIIFVSASKYIVMLRFKMYDKDFYRMVVLRRKGK